MKYSVPFYKNKGYRCAQSSMRCVISSLFPGRDIGYKKLDELTLRSGREWTSFPQIAKGFLDLGIDFEYFVRNGGLENCKNGNFSSCIKNWYGSHADKILKVTNAESTKRAAEEVIKSGKFKSYEPTREDLTDYCRNGDLSICAIDNSIIGGRKKNREGHLVVITWTGEYNVYYHDCGPVGAAPNREVPWNRFLEALKDITPFDYGVIVVPRKQER